VRAYVCCVYTAQLYAINNVIYQRKNSLFVFTASGHNRPEELGQFLLHEQHHSVPE